MKRSCLAAAAMTLALLMAGCSSGGVGTTNQRYIPQAARFVAASGTYHVYTAGQTPGFYAGMFAWDIAAAADDSMWFTDPQKGLVGRLKGGSVVTYKRGFPSGFTPFAIARGPNGDMWTGDAAHAAIASITSAGVVTAYAFTTQTSQSTQSIAFTPDGTPWFITTGPGSSLWRVVHRAVQQVPLPSGMSGDGTLAADASGNLWLLALDGKGYAEVLKRHSDGTFSRLATGLAPVAYPCCPNQAPRRMTIGPDGNPWFSGFGFGSNRSPANFMGTVDHGAVHLFAVPAKGLPIAYPSGIAATATAMWMTGGDPLATAGALWHVDHNGPKTGSPLQYDPLGLTVDSHGHAWFTTKSGNAASQIVEVIAP